MDSGEGIAVETEEAAAVASDEEVGIMNGGVAFPAKEGGVRGAVERSFFLAELTKPLLHLRQRNRKDNKERNCRESR